MTYTDINRSYFSVIFCTEYIADASFDPCLLPSPDWGVHPYVPILYLQSQAISSVSKHPENKFKLSIYLYVCK